MPLIGKITKKIQKLTKNKRKRKKKMKLIRFLVVRKAFNDINEVDDINFQKKR